MCCLFGVMNYSGKKYLGTDRLINLLAQEATVRGVDSTGVAYNKNGKLTVYKKPLSAYEMDFKGMTDSRCIIGHTRHATQGSQEKNYNNHPFMGYCHNTKFALAHNGVLWNDTFLKRKYNLPNDRIETDSFVAVQLLEHFTDFNFSTIAKMAEAVSGSFTFTMLDTSDNLWIVKGDNPLALIHFPHLKLYAYASTTQILFTALCRSDLIDDIADGEYELVEIHGGDIVRIDAAGHIETHRFNFDRYGGYGYNWQTYTTPKTGVAHIYDDMDDFDDIDEDWTYEEELKCIARSMGISDKEIDELIESGFTWDEIEDFIYCGGW